MSWALRRVLSFLALFAAGVQAHAGTFTPGQTTFPATPVGASSSSVSVTLVAQSGGTAGPAVAFTEGVKDANAAEFAIAGAGTCGANSNLLAGQSCTVPVVFSPRYPGVRHGAVTLKTAGGQLLASTLISGVGRGGLPVLIPGQISTVAGNGQWFFQGDGVPATQAPIYLPSGLAVDGGGNLYLADSINNRVRRVDAVTHTITTVAGNGNAGSAGDGGPATAAQVTSPSGIALDGAGNLYIADTGSNTIRRVDAASGNIVTIAGTPGVSGFTGDGGPATSARLNSPQALALTPAGDLLIADTSNAAIRVLTMDDGQIQTIAGTGTPGYNGDGVLAVHAQLNDPSGIAVRADGAIAIADLSNNRIRLFTTGGNISTVAGNGTLGYTGDGGNATQAQLQGPAAVAFDPAGDLLIADSVNNCVRLVYGAQGTIVTLTGTPSDDRYAGDGGPDNQARMHGPDGLFFDAGGNLWVSDRFNNRVREISGSLLTIGPYPTMKVGKTSQPITEKLMNAGNQTLTLSAPGLQMATLDATTTTCGQSPLASAGFCDMGIEFAPTTVGTSVNGSVAWNSDAPNVTPIDQLYGEVLSVEPTAVALASNANPGLLGQSVTLTATVTSDDHNRTGSVDFVEGGTTWCSGVQLGADGTATCRVPGLSLGTHNFTANYSGDNNNAASQSPSFGETIKQQAALAMGVSASPAVVTSNIIVSVSAADTTGTPTGTVVFYDGTTALQTVTLDSGGNASWSTTGFSVGQHVLSAQYSGDSANVAGTSSNLTLEIVKASTVTVLSTGNNNASVGTNITFTANVVSNHGPAPTGSVQLVDGSTLLASTQVSGNGSATFLLNTLAPGSHALTAVYNGDANSASSTSAIVTQNVQQVGTVVTLGADVDPLRAGAVVHLAAIVEMAPGANGDGPITGTVTFSDNGAVLGAAEVNASGQATLAAPGLSVGVHPIVATFSGNTNYAASHSSALRETVQQTGAAVGLSAVSSSTLMGTPATFNVAVTSDTGVPTGSVTFKDGASSLGTSPLNANGQATFSTTRLSPGSHAITAVYGGDANYVSAVSAGLQQQVRLAQPAVTLSAPASAGEAGLAVQFISTLATDGVQPSGTLTLLDGALVVATEAVPAAGTFRFTASSLPVGVHLLTAKYGGDADNAAAVSTAVSFTVQQAQTGTVLHTSANPLTQGQSLALTAAVTSDSPNPGGHVGFFDGPTLLASVALNGNGTAAYTVASPALGVHTLTAVYAGDTNHAGSTSPALPELVVQSASLAVSSNVNPSTSGLSVVFTGHMNGSPVPTGSLSFRDGGLLLGTVPLDGSGSASFATSTLSVGEHQLAVTYSGDTHFSAAAAGLVQTVVNASTSTTISVDKNPGTYGTALTLTALVTSNGGVASGTISFEEAGKRVGSAALDASGKAALTTAKLGPGVHNITAVYSGDGKASASASAPLVFSVKQVTSLAIGSSANPAQTLSAVDLTATVTNPGAAPTSGSVTFTEGASVLGTAAVDGTGHAVLSVPHMAAGQHTILASYTGDDANFSSEAAAYNQVVQVRPTTTAVTGSATDPANPQQMTLIAVVRGDGSTPPGGTVNFTSGAITLGAASVDATGVATITVIFDTPTQQVVASYGGDASFGGSQSAQTPITAGKPAQFTLSLSSADITLVSHQRTTVTVTVASLKGFTDNIALGCLGLPYAATCTFSSSQIKLNADGTATASLILDTGNPLGAGTSTASAASNSRNLLLCCSPAALLLCLLQGRGRRKRVPMLLAVLFTLAIAAGGLTGCGGLQMSGTPPGTYSFKIIGTGQGSNTTEAQAVNLVVTQ